MKAGAVRGLGVLESAAAVASRSSVVRIDSGQVQQLAALLAGGPLVVPTWDRSHHFFDGTEKTLHWLLVLDALNFCFWGDSPWEVEYEGERASGYWGLVLALRRAASRELPLWEPEFIAALTVEQVDEILAGRGQVPLLQRRWANLVELGRGLIDRWDGRFARLVGAADGSAVRLVGLVAETFLSFRDVASYLGTPVRFYKRAQLLAADLHGAFGGAGWGAFTDMNDLTAFADYKLPQLLRARGVLTYADPLARLVDSRTPLEPGGQEEVEIRANTVCAVELLRRELACRQVRVAAYELDWLLWEMAQREPLDQPHHRTLTIFY